MAALLSRSATDRTAITSAAGNVKRVRPGLVG